MIEVKEAHHFYPVLFYFRFEDPRYAVSRFSLVVLDAVSLLRSALARPEAQRIRMPRGGAVARTPSPILRTRACSPRRTGPQWEPPT
jgi:hypothetical protein